ncbi:hypothetical protein ACI00D_002824 [Cronobacter dublinensis]
MVGGNEVDYLEEDRDILTIIRFRPNRASREDNRAKCSLKQTQIFMRRMTTQSPRNQCEIPRKTT